MLLGLLTVGACSKDKDAKADRLTTYDRLLRTLYRNTVPAIRPVQLAELLQEKPESVVVLDTRTPVEYQVSHLRNARFVDYDSFKKNTFDNLSRRQTVVVYCSVGYRSERVGEQLKALGFQDVRNLYGGIFQWVNEGRTVYNQQGPTTNVHPYSPLWSPWLKSGRQVYK
ncbi:rhodanese-like domain-containing protein [Hymenobacter tibetensis]|uniref:Rhodanese-like domain-containing protein n=1 Tax=Hymenobacter tibetensis TaxID=497967 RepID=A0ABY4D390_9BACT|nr:rhodanese-like domain-containing protein [Hymenobacter tibetensis]UOG76880.1 rhodanese-like domain-containing protein [Hymenobacter tibetensis]